MNDHKLALATDEDLIQSLSYALRHSHSSSRFSQADVIRANTAAEHLLQALKLSGFVVMKGLSTPAHSLYDPMRLKLIRQAEGNQL